MKRILKFLSLQVVLMMTICVVSAATFSAGATEISHANGLTSLSASQSPTSVKLNCSTLTLGVGEEYTLVKTVSPSGANQPCTWSSSNQGVASVDSNGKVTAKKTGMASITVKTYNGKTAQCKVTVKPDPTSVKINPTSVTLGVGESYTITENTDSGTYANSANLKWTSTNTKVATVTKGSSNKATITAKATGTAYVKITLYNGKTAQCKVTVKTAPSSVTTNPSSVTLGVGESYTISENTNGGTYANAANLKWTSSNAGVATVTKGSANKAIIKAKGPGTAYIKITLYNGKTAQCKVTVKTAPSSVKTNPASVTLGVGESYTISENTNSGSYANAANLKWISSNSHVATVTKGSSNKSKITAKGAGTAYIKITLYNGKTAQCKVTVNEDPYAEKVLEIVNNERVKAGKKPLAARADLTELANIRVKEIVEKFSHERPDGTSVFDLAKARGISYGSMAENIAKGQDTPESVMSAWMNSQGHRNNILSSSYTYVGIAHYKYNDIDYWVQVFLG